MIVKDEREYALVKESGRRLARILGEVIRAVRPGVSGAELDALAEKMIRAGGDTPSFKNYKPSGAGMPFPASLCVSINDEVVHGIPTNRALKDGDIVGLDLGINHRGYFTDMARSVAVGEIDREARLLIERTSEALNAGIGAIARGGHVGDIGSAIENFITPFGYGIVRELGGHGVGRAVHEKPYIANFGKAGVGPELVEGIVLAIEPMMNLGSAAVKLSKNNFTYVTADGSISAHFEDTILITRNGIEIVTKPSV